MAGSQTRTKKLLTVCLAFLGIISLLSIFAPWVTQYSFDQQNIVERLQGPSLRHWMGTDSLGRDLYSRIIYGARLSLSVGVASALLSLCVGTTIGLLAGYKGGLTDRFLMMITDLFAIFPSSLLAILLMMFLGRGFFGILIALSITSWISHARMVRAQVMLAKELQYVESAHAIGATPFRIAITHIVPNILGPVMVSLTIQIPNNILTESFLSFIGLGLEPPHSSWGILAAEGFRALQSFPHLMIFPSLILFVTVFAFTQVGESLNQSIASKKH